MKILTLLAVLTIAGCGVFQPEPSICDNLIGFERSLCQVNETYLTSVKSANLAFQQGDISASTHKEIILQLVKVDEMLDAAELALAIGDNPSDYLIVAQDILRGLQ